MPKITFISTVHEEIGKCSANELCHILKELNPEVIFLEALNETYSHYDKIKFFSYGVSHRKLEIKAIQKYQLNNSCTYIPVLDNGLSDSFERKYNTLKHYPELLDLMGTFNSMASESGFKFLNSAECINRQEQMRALESKLYNPELEQAFQLYIDEYENSMMRNIYSFCKNNQFNSAIFMCGAAHRKSIIEKIKKFNELERININWVIYGSDIKI